MLDKSCKITIKSSFISFVNELSSQSEFLELPIVGSSHRSVNHLQSLNSIGSAIIKIMISVVLNFRAFFDWSVSDPQVIGCHFCLIGHLSNIQITTNIQLQSLILKDKETKYKYENKQRFSEFDGKYQMVKILAGSYNLLYQKLYIIITIITQQMESQNLTLPSQRMIQVLSEIMTGLNDYCRDRSKINVWSKVFWVIGIYVSKEGPLSSEAQKVINFYLQNKMQNSHLFSLINQHKQIICKIFDFATSGTESIDDALSTGMLRQIANKKLSKSLQGENPYSPTIKVLNYCIEMVALHFCQFLLRYKKANGAHLIYTTRQIPMILSRKTQTSSSSAQLLKSITPYPVVLLEGLLDNVKPILTNYLNMESLFQVTSKNFKNKKGLLTGFSTNNSSSKVELVSSVVSLNTIFDSTYAGRQMIEKKLSTLTLFDEKESKANCKWCLLTCIQEFQPILHHIFGKLPLFLRPKTNGDILSFLRKQFTPTFKYQVMNSGYIQGPFLSQYLQIFVNVGKSAVQILSFPYSKEVEQNLLKYEGERIWENIEKINTTYSKVKLGVKSIAIVPPNNFYMIASDPLQRSRQSIFELIYWGVLPKYAECIQGAIKAMEIKKKLYSNIFLLPLELAFLDYLSHEYTKVKSIQILKSLITHLQSQLEMEENIVYQILKQNSSIPLQLCQIYYEQRFCFKCRLSFLNYCCRSNRKEIFCMNCSLKLQQNSKIDQILIIYDQNTLRYPITLCKIYIKKAKVPGQKVENIYEKQICNQEFIGAFQNEMCKGKASSSCVDIPNSHMNLQKGFEIVFANKTKQMKITTPEEMLATIALKTPQNKVEREQLIKKIEIYAKSIKDIENFLKSICFKYDQKNLVSEVMWSFKKKDKIFE